MTQMPFDPVYSRILVAYDSSDQAKNALSVAARMALMFKGELIILAVVPPPSYPSIPSDAYSGAISSDTFDYNEKSVELYKKSLEEAAKYIEERFPHLKFETVLKEGRPSAIIVKEAENKAANLIVIGNRGLGGISGWILGSTSRQVVDRCTKPVLIVK